MTSVRPQPPSLPPSLRPPGGARSWVKGVAFRTVLLSFERLHGQSRVNLALSHLNDEARTALRYGTLLPSGWYPVEWYADLLQAVVKASHGGSDVIRNIATMSVEHDVRGVYRFFVEHLKPATVLSVYGKLFPRYYSPGKLTVIREDARHFTVHVRDCLGFTALMWQEIHASGRHLLTLSGASNVRDRVTKGGRDGDAFMVVEASWQ